MSKQKHIFTPKEDQIDFTHARWVPVVNIVVIYNNLILLVQRSKSNTFYPEYWNGVSGFLDDQKSLEEKVSEEIYEELGIDKQNIKSITLHDIFDQNEPHYEKTWIVHAVAVTTKSDTITLNWESSQYVWVPYKDTTQYNLLPGFDRVLTAVGEV